MEHTVEVIQKSMLCGQMPLPRKKTKGGQGLTPEGSRRNPGRGQQGREWVGPGKK